MELKNFFLGVSAILVSVKLMICRLCVRQNSSRRSFFSVLLYPCILWVAILIVVVGRAELIGVVDELCGLLVVGVVLWGFVVCVLLVGCSNGMFVDDG